MDLHQTDPEFAERFAYFAFQEVINEENQQLDEKTRYMAISAALIGCARFAAMGGLIFLQVNGCINL